MADFDRSLRSRVRRFYSLTRKFGWGSVAAGDVYSTFEQISGANEAGFVRLRPGLWTREIDSDVTHVLKLQRLKGAAYNLLWGVSLSYVPVAQGKRLRWHRTPKAADLVLFEDPVDFFELDRAKPKVVELYYTEDGHGPVHLRKTMSRMWSHLSSAVNQWLAEASDIDGVLKKAEEQAARQWRSIGHNPDPRLVYAFALKRAARFEEAVGALDRYLALPGTSAEEADLLRKALGAPPNPSLQRTPPG